MGLRYVATIKRLSKAFGHHLQTNVLNPVTVFKKALKKKYNTNITNVLYIFMSLSPFVNYKKPLFLQNCPLLSRPFPDRRGKVIIAVIKAGKVKMLLAID